MTVLSKKRKRKTVKLACIVSVVAAASSVVTNDDTRRACLFRNRKLMHQHFQFLLNEGEFERYYRCDFDDFKILEREIGPSLEVDEKMSRLRTGTDPIKPDLIIASSLRFLFGGSYHDIRNNMGISRTAFYDQLYKFCDAVISLEYFKIRLPETAMEQQQAARDFAAFSDHNVIRAAVFALDGWLCQINAPISEDKENPICVRDYWSGHYGCYGINVQAACDAFCRFVYVDTTNCGGSNDYSAHIQALDFIEYINNLPIGYFGIGDNAYVATEHMIVPFSAADNIDTWKSAFNYYLSQIRIKIEMAFGYLVTKFRIFRKPLEVKLIVKATSTGRSNVDRVIRTSMALHNFFITRRIEKHGVKTISPNEIESLGLNIENEEDFAYLRTQNDDGTTIERNSSVLTSIIMNYIRSNNLKRPMHNRIRNPTLAL